jgi:hypothetical protein
LSTRAARSFPASTAAVVPVNWCKKLELLLLLLVVVLLLLVVVVVLLGL